MRSSFWPQRRFEPTNILVGHCAWDLSLLTGPHQRQVLEQPSLVVAGADESPHDLARAAGVLREFPDIPVALEVHEPTFARRFRQHIEERIAALGRSKVELLVLRVQEPQDLKGGSLLQTMFELRSSALAENLGLWSEDVRGAQWLAENTAVRVMGFPYSLEDQSAGFAAVSAAHDYGMACLTRFPHRDPASDLWLSDELDSLRFALGRCSQVLPVLSKPLPQDVEPMSEPELESRWQAYSSTHAAPAPLPRGLPPEFT